MHGSQSGPHTDQTPYNNDQCSVPGSLTDSYDELGNHYVVPVYCISFPVNLIQNEDTSVQSSGSNESVQDESTLGEELMIKIRISTTNKDYKWNVRTGETVLAVKKRVHNELGIEANRQRWFFSGKMLFDKMTIEEARIPRGYVVQVIVKPEDM